MINSIMGEMRQWIDNTQQYHDYDAWMQCLQESDSASVDNAIECISSMFSLMFQLL